MPIQKDAGQVLWIDTVETGCLTQTFEFKFTVPKLKDRETFLHRNDQNRFKINLPVK